MTTWILFDLSGVVAQMFWGPKTEFSNSGKILTKDDLKGLYSGDIYRQFMIGEVSEEFHITEYIKRKQLDIPPDEIRNIFKNNQYYIEGIKEFLAILKNNYNLAILTNEGREWVRYKVDSLKLDNYFKTVVESNQLGLLKPDINFYLESLKIINGKPEECIFIDDQEKNCLSAEKVGIKSIVFKNISQLKKELSKLNIKVD